MGASTPHLNLYKPGGGSSGLITPDEVADIDRINDNSDKIDAFASAADADITSLKATRTGNNQNYVGLAAGKAGVPPVGAPALRIGDTYQETDGNKILWWYDGTSWVYGQSSSYVLFPTTVVNGTITSTGDVTFSAVASVSLDGVFSSRFSEYELSWEITSKSAAAFDSLRLRKASVDASTAAYAWRRAGTQGSGYIEASPAPTAEFSASLTGLAYSKKRIRLMNPAVVGFTQLVEGTGMETDNTSIVNLISLAGTHRVSDSYDGFSLISAAGTITGKVKVRGIL